MILKDNKLESEGMKSLEKYLGYLGTQSIKPGKCATISLLWFCFRDYFESNYILS